MKLRRALLLMIAVALVLTAVPARAAADNPYWRVKTNLPVETIEGTWVVAENDREATLEFEGVNVIGQETKFTAGWRTGWFKRGQSQSGEFSYLVDPIAQGELKPMVRIQFKGYRWSPWFGGRMPMMNGGGTYLWDGGSMAAPPEPIRFEWKVVGTVEGNAYVDGSVTINVD